MKEFTITISDIREAERYVQQDQVKEFTLDGLLKNYFYCLFSIGQLYKIHISLYRMVVENNLYLSFLSDKHALEMLKEIVRKTRFPKSIWSFILYFKEHWGECLSLFSKILRDDYRENGIFFREKLVKLIKGFGWKVATLFLVLCGYDDMAVIDIWSLRFLRDYMGYDIPILYDRHRTPYG